ncbi:MAG: YqaA family protein [Beijerinckiaceae bacterium]
MTGSFFNTEILGLLVTSFLTATLLPGSSEVALAALLKLGTTPPWPLIIAATLGNTLGSITNWLIGRFGAHWRDHPRFPLTPQQMNRVEAWYQKYGVWTLVFAWVPIIGDPMTVAAGLLRTPLIIFIPLVAAGKFLRYIAVAGLTGLF